MSPRFRFDPVGFPMIRVEVLGGYLHWLPVTKVQCEAFIAAQDGTTLDRDWYDEVLAGNGRVTASRVDPSNYWKAFVTGVRPSEAEAYSAWSRSLGPWTDSLPTREEWLAAYGELKRTSAIEVGDLAEMSPSPRARALLIHVAEAIRSERSAADQMLMRGGVMEWVKNGSRQGPWAAFGRTDPRFHSTLFDPDTGRPSYPIDPEGARLASHGFRLLGRPTRGSLIGAAQ